MPKALVNNKIVYPNLYGRIIQHDIFLNQSVTNLSSPTFSNLQLTGDLTVEGNLYVLGNASILDTNIIEFEDNIILLNRLETGSGITLNQAGFEIERGTLENYKIVFNESDDTFRIGFASSTQAVATREDVPLLNGVMIWDSVNSRLNSSNAINIDLSLDSTTNSTSHTSGNLVIDGGIGIAKDVFIKGILNLEGTNNTSVSILYNDNSNNMNIKSVSDIYITTGNTIGIPFNKSISFGSTDQSVSCNSVNNDLNINGLGNINITLQTGKRIAIPNQIPISFSTQNEKIYTDSSNNMVVAGNQDVELRPGTNKKVFVPVDIPISFGTASQQISANLNNDLSVVAGNNILLTPGSGLDVRIPTDNPIKFGGSGSQKIYSNSNNELIIQSTSDLQLNSSNVKIPQIIPLTFGNSSNVKSDSNGNLLITSLNQVIFNNTIDATSSSNGSIYIKGGLSSEKNIYTAQKAISHGLEIKNNSDENVIKIDPITSTSGILIINGGDGSTINPTTELSSVSNNGLNLLHLKSIYDTTNGYAIGRGTSTINTGRSMTVNLPSYSEYNTTGNRSKFIITSNNGLSELFSVESDTGNISIMGGIGVNNSNEAINATTASFVVQGGLGIVNNIYMNGRITERTNSTEALLITDSSNNQTVLVDTINKHTTFNNSIQVVNTSGTTLLVSSTFTNALQTSFTNTIESTDISNGSFVVNGGMNIFKKLRVDGNVYFNNILDMNTAKITSVGNPTNSQDVATKSYVDLVKQGLYPKDSVLVATTIAGNLNTDYIVGSTIDNVVLSFGDRILIKNQTNPIENGIYVSQTSGSPSRSIDLQTGMSASGIFVFARQGSMNASIGFICNSISPTDIIDTDSINFTEFTGLGQVIAGNALSKTFNQLDVNVDNSSIEIVGDSLRIKSSVAGTGLTGGSGIPLETSFDQSHITKIGTINTGVWQGTNIQTIYGGTGRSFISSGSVLLGNGLNALNTSFKLHFNTTQGNLGIGTNNPLKTLHLQNTNDSVFLLNADSDGLNSTAKSEILFGNTNNTHSSITLTRTSNDIANNIYSGALVLAMSDNNTTANIQFATQQESRLTILHNGNIGINTSNPTTNLYINGTFTTDGLTNFESTTDSLSITDGSIVIDGGVAIAKNLNIGNNLFVYNTDPSTSSAIGSVVFNGGLAINCAENSSNLGNGGALTILGGTSIGGDLYIGGQINGSGSSSSTFAYLTLTATDEALNLTSGTLVTFGGITIQCTTNSVDVSNGGALLIAGGASIGGDIYIGGNSNHYGNITFNGPSSDLIVFNSNFHITQNTTSNDFYISRYNTSGSFIENSMSINNSGLITLKKTLISDSTVSSTNGSASLVLNGGQYITKNLIVAEDTFILSTRSSTSITNGSLVINGGVGISENANIGGKLNVSNSLLYGAGNGLFDVANNTNGSNLWNYLGVINNTIGSFYTEINIHNSLGSNNLVISITGTNPTFSHSLSGDSLSELIVYKEDSSENHHLYLYSSPNSKNVVNVIHSTNPLDISNEGISSEPSGSFSGYTNLWTNVYSTNSESNLQKSFGNTTIEGSTFKVNDNLPIIGYNNANTTSSRDLGILFQKYQISNDAGTGDIVSNGTFVVDTIPSQTSLNLNQLKLSNITSSVDNYYNGWWVKVITGTNINQTRQIISYNGSLRVATLDSDWTTQNPTTNDTVNLYGGQYVSLYFDESVDKFKLVYASEDSINLYNHNYADLQIKNLYISDTTASTNISSGGIYSLGGISIDNSNNSVSSTNGGSFTTLGGASIRKTLFVGDTIAVGNSFTPQENIHLRQTNSTIRLERDSGSTHSFIDFVENGSNTRFGILNSNYIAFTYNSTNNSPNLSNCGLVLSSSGNIGIGITSPNSLLTLSDNNYISQNSTNGYLGVGLSIGSHMTFDITTANIYGSDNIKLHTQNVERLRINSSGDISIYNTTKSVSNTIGSLILAGGVAITCTENSVNVSNGSALSVGGGASIGKDLYIGGNIYVSGIVAAAGSVSTPSISFSNTQGCSISTYNNSNLITISNQGLLTFYIEVLPESSSTNCSFEFALPSRTTNLTHRLDLISSISGYTDDTNLTSIFNMLSVGKVGTTNGFVKFHSASTNIHFITIYCRYSLV